VLFNTTFYGLAPVVKDDGVVGLVLDFPLLCRCCHLGPLLGKPVCFLVAVDVCLQVAREEGLSQVTTTITHILSHIQQKKAQARKGGPKPSTSWKQRLQRSNMTRW
jgi:hypothetical protein